MQACYGERRVVSCHRCLSCAATWACGLQAFPLMPPMCPAQVSTISEDLRSLWEECRDLIDLIFNLATHQQSQSTQTLAVVSTIFLPITVRHPRSACMRLHVAFCCFRRSLALPLPLPVLESGGGGEVGRLHAPDRHALSVLCNAIKVLAPAPTRKPSTCRNRGPPRCAPAQSCGCAGSTLAGARLGGMGRCF